MVSSTTFWQQRIAKSDKVGYGDPLFPASDREAALFAKPTR
jgi:hypothetical protein